MDSKTVVTRQASRAGELALVGGRLCLDFVNTCSGRGGPRYVENLTNFEALLAWCQHAGILSARESDALAAQAKGQPTQAHLTFQNAVELRDTLHRIFCAVARHEKPADSDLESLNRWIARAFPHLILNRAQAQFSLSWERAESFDRVLWPIVRSAVDVLTTDPLDRLRECGGHHCGWLFLDTSKNSLRRWCEMSLCGNRAKARQNYLRRKAKRQVAASSASRRRLRA